MQDSIWLYMTLGQLSVLSYSLTYNRVKSIGVQRVIRMAKKYSPRTVNTTLFVEPCPSLSHVKRHCLRHTETGRTSLSYDILQSVI